MTLEQELAKRSADKCELCSASESLSAYIIPPSTESVAHNAIYICSTCKNQIENPDTVDAKHWRCLNDSMWSTHAPVQVMAFRMLHRLKNESWPQDLLDMMYLDDETRAWAMEGVVDEENAIIHLDSNGVVLKNGDNVVLTQTLDVKGSSLSAKRGTAVKRIRLVSDNAEQIEGKVEGQQIVILTKFVKKQ